MSFPQQGKWRLTTLNNCVLLIGYLQHLMMPWHFAVMVNTFFPWKTFKLSHIFCFALASTWNTPLGQRYLQHGWLENSLKRIGRWRITLLLTRPLIGFQRVLIHFSKCDSEYTPLASLTPRSISQGRCEGEQRHRESKEHSLTWPYMLYLDKLSSALKLYQVHKDPPSKRKNRECRKGRLTRRKPQFKGLDLFITGSPTMATQRTMQGLCYCCLSVMYLFCTNFPDHRSYHSNKTDFALVLSLLLPLTGIRWARQKLWPVLESVVTPR